MLDEEPAYRTTNEVPVRLTHPGTHSFRCDLRRTAGTLVAAILVLGLAGAASADFDASRSLTIPREDTAAVDAWLPLAEAGDALAQTSIGHLYSQGSGVEQNDEKAVYWWNKAADQGEPAAQFNLGLCYLYGRGVPQDLVRAYTWLSLALDQGDAAALEWLVAVAGRMTDDEIAEANALAADWNRIKETEHTDPWYKAGP